MATHIPELKREYLNMIPDFTGDAKLLARFLEICEKLVVRFYNAVDPQDFQNEFLMSSIYSKIKGDVAIKIANYTIITWDDLKLALIKTYSDKRDLFTLIIELTHLKQGNENCFDFFDKVVELLNLQISYIHNHSNAAQAPVLCQVSRDLALRVLLQGLKEPIGSLMKTKNPDDLSSALNMLTNDFQHEISKIQNNKLKFPSSNHVVNPNYNFKPAYNNNFNQARPSFNNRPNYNNNYNSRIRQPFNKPNYGNNNGQFQKSYNRPNNNYYKPTPMSTSTKNTFIPGSNPEPSRFTNQFKPKGNPIPEELYVNENENSEQPEVESENYFLGMEASSNKVLK